MSEREYINLKISGSRIAVMKESGKIKQNHEDNNLIDRYAYFTAMSAAEIKLEWRC